MTQEQTKEKDQTETVSDLSEEEKRAYQEKLGQVYGHFMRTPRGQKVFDWFQKQDIKVHFTNDSHFAALYEPSNNTLYLNSGANPKQLFIAMLEQMRRCWNKTEVRPQVSDNLNHFSELVRRRYEEADTRSFVAAMVSDYTRQTGDFSVYLTMNDIPAFKEAQMYIGMASQNPGCDFTLMQRAGFDSYFRTSANWAETEKYTTGQYIDDMSKKLDGVISGNLDKYFMAEINAEMTDPDFDPENEPPVVLDLNFQAAETISRQDLAKYGQAGFGMEGANYMTGISGPQAYDSDDRLAPTQESEEALKTFVENNIGAFRNTNVLGRPDVNEILPPPVPTSRTAEADTTAEAEPPAQQDAAATTAAPEEQPAQPDAADAKADAAPPPAKQKKAGKPPAP